MSYIDPQITQQIVQFLATYGTPAGIAAVQTIGTNAAQALESGATKAIKALWRKLQHKSKQEGGIVEDAFTAFEIDPTNTEHQYMLSFIIKQLCNKYPDFAQEITQLYDQVQHDLAVQSIIQNIHNSQVGVTGINLGTVNQYHQPNQQGTLPPYQLKVQLSLGFLELGGVRTGMLSFSVLNTGSMTSYVSHVAFESNVDGQIRGNGFNDYGKSQIVHKFGEPLRPGQSHTYLHDFNDLGIFFSAVGKKAIPIAVIVYDQIGNKYREPFSEDMSKRIMSHVRS
jgi:hypothetical protein